jgi:hypothetical protein
MRPFHPGNIQHQPAGHGGGGGNHPYLFSPPIPDWVLVLLADPQLSNNHGAVKHAIYEYLTEIGEIEIQYDLAIKAADTAALKAKTEADQRLRQKTLA